jgi:hypothetical protein
VAKQKVEFVEFEENGHTLTCRAASSPATPGSTWWWLELKGDAQRYAAFLTAPSDTKENVRTRMIAWHEKLLIDRARPREFRPTWGRPPGRPKNAPEGTPEGGTAI